MCCLSITDTIGLIIYYKTFYLSLILTLTFFFYLSISYCLKMMRIQVDGLGQMFYQHEMRLFSKEQSSVIVVLAHQDGNLFLCISKCIFAVVVLQVTFLST